MLYVAAVAAAVDGALLRLLIERPNVQCVPWHMNLNLSIPLANYNNYTPNTLTSANVQNGLNADHSRAEQCNEIHKSKWQITTLALLQQRQRERCTIAYIYIYIQKEVVFLQ